MRFNATQRVLLVDDDPLSLEVLASYLAGTGYEIYKAQDGESALRAARDLSPDIVFLDIMMPGMDGKKVCQRLKGDEATRNIPVVMVTSLDTKADKLDCIRAGADDFLTKPADKAELLARCTSLLRLKRFHDERDNAYSQIIQMTSFCGNVIAGFEPIRFSLPDMYNKLMTNIVRPAAQPDARPSCAVIIKTDGVVPLEGSLFCKPHGIAKWGALSDEALRTLTVAVGMDRGQDGFVSSSAAAPLTGFPVDVTNQAGQVHNYAFCHSGHTAIICLNYGKEVIRYDLEVLRSLLSHAQFFETIAMQARENEDAFIYTIKALARAAEANDEDTGNHIMRVSQYTYEVALSLGLSSHEAEELRNASVTHDVGKVHISPALLRKEGTLSDKEFEEIKMHTVFGVNILGASPRLEMARQIARSHHEKWDGTGYPQGLKGGDIPLAGRIVAIADVYDALRNRRPYKAAYSHERAMEIITEGNGRTDPSHFDPDVMRAFINIADSMENIFERLSEPEGGGLA